MKFAFIFTLLLPVLCAAAEPQVWEKLSFQFERKYPQSNVNAWEWTAKGTPPVKLTYLQAEIEPQTLAQLTVTLEEQIKQRGGVIFQKDLQSGVFAFLLAQPTRNYYELNLWRYYVSEQHHTSAAYGLSFSFTSYAAAQRYSQTQFQVYYNLFLKDNIPQFNLP